MHSTDDNADNDLAEYKDLEARVDALRAAHISVLKYVVSVVLPFPADPWLPTE